MSRMMPIAILIHASAPALAAVAPVCAGAAGLAKSHARSQRQATGAAKPVSVVDGEPDLLGKSGVCDGDAPVDALVAATWSLPVVAFGVCDSFGSLDKSIGAPSDIPTATDRPDMLSCRDQTAYF